MDPTRIETVRGRINKLLDELSERCSEQRAFSTLLHMAAKEVERLSEENDTLDQQNFALKLQNHLLETDLRETKQGLLELEDEVRCAMNEALAAREEELCAKREAAVAQVGVAHEANQVTAEAFLASMEVDHLRDFVTVLRNELERSRRLLRVADEDVMAAQAETEEFKRKYYELAGIIIEDSD